MKKFLSICTAGMLFLGSGLCYSGNAQSKDNITVIVDGNPMTVVGHPAVLDAASSRVMIPFKSLFLAIGVQEKDIKWNAQTSTAKGTREGIEVELTKNNKMAKVNGQLVEMDAPPVIMGTSMMVPLSFVAKQMGGETKWKGSPDYIVNISMSYGLFPFDPNNPSTGGNTGSNTGGTGTGTENSGNTGNNSGNTGSVAGKAPAKDTAASNSKIHGTWAMQNMNREKFVLQFKADNTLDINNVSAKKTGKGTYVINGDSVSIVSDLLNGVYTLEKTTYDGTSYYVLNSSDSSKTIAITAISYDEFASVY
ncbi:MAG: copper amine oxidase N-terminal domain-containing protein [Proteocatella sp.]